MNTSTITKSLSTRFLLMISMLVMFGGWQVARASTSITVNSTITNATNVSGVCTLRDALQIVRDESNVNVPNSTCIPVGSTPTQPYTINLQANTTYNLTVIDNSEVNGDPTGLPTLLFAPATIEGNGAVIQRDQSTTTPHFKLMGSFTNLTLHNLTLTGGITDSFGGAVAIERGNLTISGCTITNNKAVQGGAIAVFAGSALSITNSTIANNTAYNGGGGGIYYNNDLSPISITSSTIAYNQGTSANGDDNLLLDFTFTTSPTTLKLDHTIIVTKNTGHRNCSYVNSTGKVTIDAKYNLASDATCGFDGTSNNNIVTLTPGLDTVLADNGGPTQTIKLLSGQGINGGGICSGPPDQRGAPRPGVLGTGVKPTCDIGAYETGDPQISLVMPSSGLLDFGAVQQGTMPSPSMSVEVKNSGNSDLTLTSVSLAAGSSANFVLATPDLSAVKAQNYRDFSVTYTPNANTTDTGTLDIASNSATNNPLVVNLTGSGTGFVIPPIQQIQDILSFLSTHGQPTGCLIALGPNSKAASGKYNAFVNMINSAGSLITAGQDTKACSQLADAEKKVDGQPNPPDFIGGSCAPQLDNMIINLMNTLPGCSFPQP